MEYLNQHYHYYGDKFQPIISFDDGYESVYNEAFPVISQYDFKTIVFPVTCYIGKTNEWDINFIINRTKHLTKPQLQELSDLEWEIGSHGHLHRSCFRMNNEEIQQDLMQSKVILEELIGKSVTSLSPPFGKLSDSYLKIAEDMGYERIFIQDPLRKYQGYQGSLEIIKRKSVYSIDSDNAIKRKAQNSKIELYKENIIHYFSNATVAVKEML